MKKEKVEEGSLEGEEEEELMMMMTLYLRKNEGEDE
jgi:hypothetical protein